jgi:hypothetical protein
MYSVPGMPSLATNKRTADQLQPDSSDDDGRVDSDDLGVRDDLNKRSKPNVTLPNTSDTTTAADKTPPSSGARMDDTSPSEHPSHVETPSTVTVNKAAVVSGSPDGRLFKRQELRKIADEYAFLYYDNAYSYPDPSTVRANLKPFPDRAHGVLAEDFCCKYERQNA